MQQQRLRASVPIIFLLISGGCYDCIQINEVNFSPSSLQLICGALLRKSAHVVLCSSPPMCCLMRTWSWCLGRLQGSRCNLHLHWGGCVESCTTHFTLYYGPPEHIQSLPNYLQAIHLWWQTCRNCAPFLRQRSLISEQPKEPTKEKKERNGPLHYLYLTTFHQYFWLFAHKGSRNYWQHIISRKSDSLRKFQTPNSPGRQLHLSLTLCSSTISENKFQR